MRLDLGHILFPEPDMRNRISGWNFGWPEQVTMTYGKCTQDSVIHCAISHREIDAGTLVGILAGTMPMGEWKSHIEVFFGEVSHENIIGVMRENALSLEQLDKIFMALHPVWRGKNFEKLKCAFRDLARMGSGQTEAMQFTGENAEAIFAFIGCTDCALDEDYVPGVASFRAPDDRRTMYLQAGDYMVKNGDGESYPCRHDVFSGIREILDEGRLYTPVNSRTLPVKTPRVK